MLSHTKQQEEFTIAQVLNQIAQPKSSQKTYLNRRPKSVDLKQNHLYGKHLQRNYKAIKECERGR